MMKKHKRKIITIFMILAAGMLLIFGAVVIYIARPQEKPSGILLAFDDYYAENWEQNLDLLDEYGVKVTFFVNTAEPTEFCYHAIERGHEIGFHTIDHVNLTEAAEEELWMEAIEPIETFRKAGIELTSFAYPYGASTVELDTFLLQYYTIVRGGWYYELTPRENFKKGYVESRPIDNSYMESDFEFQLHVTKMLVEAKLEEGTMVSLYSHGIEGGETCISPKRLKFLFELADFLNLEFYTYKDMQ